MQKKIFSLILTFSMVLCMMFASLISVQASENDESIDGSYLTLEEYSEGRMHSGNPGITTYGEFMMDGECSITKSGIGKIYVYASTTANRYVDYVCAIIYVDRYNQSTGKWDQIDAWKVDKENDYYISTSKMMSVDRGYYYRVHADHICGNKNSPYDEGITVTDGIYIN